MAPSKKGQAKRQVTRQVTREANVGAQKTLPSEDQKALAEAKATKNTESVPGKQPDDKSKDEEVDSGDE